MHLHGSLFPSQVYLTETCCRFPRAMQRISLEIFLLSRSPPLNVTLIFDFLN